MYWPKQGLARKNWFSKDGNHEQFIEKISQAYPHLVQCGGFTLHRAATGGYGLISTPCGSMLNCWDGRRYVGMVSHT